MPLLSEEQVKATFSESRRQATVEDDPPFDFLPYFEEITKEDFEGHDFSAGIVQFDWLDTATISACAGKFRRS